MRLTPQQAELFVRDLRQGPSRRFCRSTTCALPEPVDVDRLRSRFAELVRTVPEIGWRVRRAGPGWAFEPAALRPQLYVERHRVDRDSTPARQRLSVEVRRPVDPVVGPLAWASLLRFHSGGSQLVVGVHELAETACPLPRLVRALVAESAARLA
jgi:hypothetical protein